MRKRVAHLRAWICEGAEDLLGISRALGTEYRDVLAYAAAAAAHRRDSIHVALDGVQDWGAVKWALVDGLPGARPWLLTIREGSATIWSMLYDAEDAFVLDIVALATAAASAAAPKDAS